MMMKLSHDCEYQLLISGKMASNKIVNLYDVPTIGAGVNQILPTLSSQVPAWGGRAVVTRECQAPVQYSPRQTGIQQKLISLIASSTCHHQVVDFTHSSHQTPLLY